MANPRPLSAGSLEVFPIATPPKMIASRGNSDTALQILKRARNRTLVMPKTSDAIAILLVWGRLLDRERQGRAGGKLPVVLAAGPRVTPSSMSAAAILRSTDACLAALVKTTRKFLEQ